ncbi:hypothetical protein JG687_00007883 [Phytophthora cactorum]|uniref:Ubiquitin-like protease family profile domain-containing protein n=1 Tax=Phytophthora cactorum TaxID=29920 RepID=A0A8T1UJ64_9STRA|nr:hypothetical protein JG687_00007883 [Phytophthora cactorum]
MRLGLASPSAPQASDRRHSPAVARRSSVFCPIDVDGDSTDDAKSPASRHHDLSLLSSANNRSSFLDLSIDTTNNTGTKRHQARVQDLQYDDSETKRSEHKNDAGPHSSAPQSPDKQEESKKPPLNFFFKIGDQSTPKKPRRDSVSSGRRDSTSARSSPAPDELHEVISAARTSICGQMFDRCELEFGKDRVELTIWKDNKARWQGEVKYAHMVRFCFSRVDRPPYILLLQLDSSRGRSDFATFYDPIFAKVCEENEAKGQPTPKVYGVVFYFDEEMDYMRCQSMGDNNPRFLWRHLPPWQQQQTYFFTSHFFTQLNGTNGAHELTTADPDERFARVARWTQKETNLFDKRFLFIPINDSFHWSIAVFCNPGSAIIKKHRKVRRCRAISARSSDKREVVDLVDGEGEKERISAVGNDGDSAEEEIEEEEVRSCQEDRLAYPPCLLFLDSLRCHRKKKFTKMLRDYLECEWKARYASSAAVNVPKTEDGVDEEVPIVTLFDSESIGLLEPNIPLQSNSSDCGVFLLMYAASIVHRFPAGVTREDLENNLTSSLTPDMFRDEHVLEFREYLQQLLFSLQFLEKHGIPEEKVKDEELEMFTID